MKMTDLEFDFVRDLVRADTAIVVEPNKKYLAESRLAPLAENRGFPSITALLTALQMTKNSDLRRAIVESMAIHETSFFRDLPMFDALRDTVIPEVMERRGQERRMTLWCAASSSGQEPYSVCMHIKEHFPELANWQIDFIASDFSLEILEKARHGRFNQVEANRGLPARLLMRYFTQASAEWQIDESIRKMVAFQQINLAGAWPTLPKFDIVFLRNVMIYFDLDTRREILRKIRQLLNGNGYLFLGGTETTLGVDQEFRTSERSRNSGCFRLQLSQGALQP